MGRGGGAEFSVVVRRLEALLLWICATSSRCGVCRVWYSTSRDASLKPVVTVLLLLLLRMLLLLLLLLLLLWWWYPLTIASWLAVVRSMLLLLI